MTPDPIVVFDLDGTLVDTAPDLMESLNHSLSDAGMAAADAAGLRAMLGHGGRALIERAFQVARRPLPAAEHDRLFNLFLAHYGENMPGRSRPYPGVPEAIERLEKGGFRLAVCTNKTEAFAVRLLGKLDLARHFAAIRGQDSYAFRKPDPRHLTATIADAGGDPNRAVMVGDSRTDVDTAKAAGIPVVAVDFGYSDHPVREFEPSKVISHFDQLTVALVERLVASGHGR